MYCFSAVFYSISHSVFFFFFLSSLFINLIVLFLPIWNSFWFIRNQLHPGDSYLPVPSVTPHLAECLNHSACLFISWADSCSPHSPVENLCIIYGLLQGWWWQTNLEGKMFFIGIMLKLFLGLTLVLLWSSANFGPNVWPRECTVYYGVKCYYITLSLQFWFLKLHLVVCLIIYLSVSVHYSILIQKFLSIHVISEIWF